MEREKDNNKGIVKGIFRTYAEYWNNNVVWGAEFVSREILIKCIFLGLLKL